MSSKGIFKIGLFLLSYVLTGIFLLTTVNAAISQAEYDNSPTGIVVRDLGNGITVASADLTNQGISMKAIQQTNTLKSVLEIVSNDQEIQGKPFFATNGVAFRTCDDPGPAGNSQLYIDGIEHSDQSKASEYLAGIFTFSNDNNQAEILRAGIEFRKEGDPGNPGDLVSSIEGRTTIADLSSIRNLMIGYDRLIISSGGYLRSSDNRNRESRTIVGISQDGTKVFLVTKTDSDILESLADRASDELEKLTGQVINDGSNTGIGKGARLEFLANRLIDEFGIYRAILLDGGGSSQHYHNIYSQSDGTPIYTQKAGFDFNRCGATNNVRKVGSALVLYNTGVNVPDITESVTDIQEYVCPTSGYYCGDTINPLLNSDNLYFCSPTDAEPQFVQSCTYSCNHQPQGTPDFCNAASGSSGNSNCANVSHDGITLFDNTECFGSQYQVAQSGYIDLWPLGWNDRTSSIHVGNGWSVKVWEHTTGTNGEGSSRCLTGSMWDLTKDYYTEGNTTLRINNTVSALEIFGDNSCGNGNIGGPSASGVVEFFGNSNYSGNAHFNLTSGSSNQPSAGQHYKSFRLPSGWSMITYTGENQTNEEKCWESSEPLVENHAWHDRIESVHIYTTNICPQPEEPGVRLYSNTGHSGNEKKVLTDQTSLAAFGFGNDDLESIKVEGNWDAVIYADDNFGGAHQYVDGSRSDLGNADHANGIVGKNQASSIRVIKTDNEAFTLYDLGDRNGQRFSSDRTIYDLDHWDFNDKAKSLQLKPGFEIIVCEHSNFRGACGRAKATDTERNFNDIREISQSLRDSNDNAQASSIQVCPGECPPTPSSPVQAFPISETRINPGTPIDFIWEINDGEEYYVEIWGGGLTTSRTSNWISGSVWNASNLPSSSSTYNWRVKGWNQYGESNWSETFTFIVNDEVPESATIFGSTFGTIEDTFTFDFAVLPTSTQNLSYVWSPEPDNGQGTVNATFTFSKPGVHTITAVGSNAAGSATQTIEVITTCQMGSYQAEYFDNTNVSGDPVDTECVSEINNNWGTQGPTSLMGYGNGSDGDLIITADVTDNPIDSSTHGIAGTNQLYASNPEFNPGQKIFIHQTKKDNAGVYQITEIASYDNTAGIITTTDSLAYDFKTDYGVGDGNKAQVLVIKQYKNVTIDSGAQFYAKAWDGEVGGILVFDVQNNLTVNGGLNAGGKGYSGGRAMTGQHGHQGEGELGGKGSIYSTPKGIGGGGGCSNNYGNPAGGGGGSNYTSGTPGQNGNNNGCEKGGEAGNVFDYTSVNKLMFGGGGGSGGGKSENGGESGKGGDGGGIIYVSTLHANINGQITSVGGNGSAGRVNTDGADGGGGAGGSIVLNVLDVTLVETVNLKVNGGLGATENGNQHGGNGGNGYIQIKDCTENDCAVDNFSARYTGLINPSAGNYNFSTKADDGVRVFVNGETTPIIDDWVDGYSEQSTEVTLQDGVNSILVEFYENTGNADIFVDYEKVSATTAPSEFINLNNYTIHTYDDGTQGTGTQHQIYDSGATLYISGNDWKRIDYPYDITSNTILEFEFKSANEGEVHGVGFDNNDVVDDIHRFFKVHGTQAWGIRDFDDYAPSDWKQYSIPVGDFYSGQMQYLTFANDHDDVTPASAESYFRNIKVYERDTSNSFINLNNYTIHTYDDGTQGTGTQHQIYDSGATLYISGNDWKRIDYPYDITPNTILEFEFKSANEGEVHGVGFDNNDVVDDIHRFFKVYGTQAWGIRDFDDYAPSDWKQYSIPVGDFYSGQMQYLTFANDHDDVTPASAESYFRNIKVYEVE